MELKQNHIKVKSKCDSPYASIRGHRDHDEFNNVFVNLNFLNLFLCNFWLLFVLIQATLMAMYEIRNCIECLGNI